ncbi:MAG: hypothetical protein WCS94_13925 [Verrucomicrobiota bacterium]
MHPDGYEKLQLIQRLPAPIIRHLLQCHRHDELLTSGGAQELNLSRTDFYKLNSQYLHPCASVLAKIWSPGVSGGNHQSVWPESVTALLKKLLVSKPPSTSNLRYSFTARSFRLQHTSTFTCTLFSAFENYTT